MRHLLPIAILAVTSTASFAGTDVRKTIEAGLKSLTEDAVAWKSERKCSSCHHVPMTIWALNEAKRLGYTVDEKARTELTSWVLAKDDPAKVNPKQAERKQININQTPLMLALGFESGDLADATTRDGLKTMLKLLLDDQDKDGAWRLTYVWEPHGSTPDVMTTLALLALSSNNAPNLGGEAKAAQEKGLKWLAETKPADTPQSEGLRLVLSKRMGRPPGEREPLAKKLVARQNADGGWGQATAMKSDAFATGQALFALAEVGRTSNDPAILKAHEYLTKTQVKGGSWEMASRPGGPGGKSAKNVEPISHVGTAWAVLGLMKTSAPIAKLDREPSRPSK